jgi:Anti-sigma factor NepR
VSQAAQTETKENLAFTNSFPFLLTGTGARSRTAKRMGVIVMGDRPASLNPKAVDRIGAQLRRLYSEGSDSPMPETISDLLSELEEPSPAKREGAKAVPQTAQYL